MSLANIFDMVCSDEPFRNRNLMFRGGGHAIVASVVGRIQVEVAVEHVIQGIAGHCDGHTDA